MNQWFLYAGSVIIAGWGLAHLVNTKGVLVSFEPMSVDTRRVVAMEWIMEGLTLIFVAVLVVLVTTLADPQHAVSILIYRASAVMLIVMAAVSLFTGARVAFWAYKLCPFVFTASGVAFFLGSM